MTHPDGGFYSAEDADSEGKEGKFYCWTREELCQAADGPRSSTWRCRYFGVTEGGNFVDDQPIRIRCPTQTSLSIVHPKL
jgi:uncharacterized protein YyaL (SSP411 family)